MNETTTTESPNWIDEFAASASKCIETVVGMSWEAWRDGDGTWQFHLWPALGRTDEEQERMVYDKPVIDLVEIRSLFTDVERISYDQERLVWSGSTGENEVDLTVWIRPRDDAEVEYVMDLTNSTWRMLQAEEKQEDWTQGQKTHGVQSGHVATTERDSEPGVQSGDVASTDSEPLDPESQALQERLGRQVASVLVRLNTPDEAMIPMACLSQSISNMLIAIKTEDADAVAHAANEARASMEALQDEGIGSLVAACAATTCVLAEMDDMQPDTRRCVACAIRFTMTGEPPMCEPKTMPDPSTKSTMLN